MRDELTLRFSDEVFQPVIGDADAALQRLITNMVEKGSTEGTVSIKVDIELVREWVENFDPAVQGDKRLVMTPKLTHKVSSMMQMKDETKGVTMYTDHELVWDAERGEYVMRPIVSAQQTIWNAEYTVSEERPGAEREETEGTAVALIPEHIEDHPAPHSVSIPEEPFAFLRQFIGDKMKVYEALGNYTVRAMTDGTSYNTVVLSSAYEPTNPFYCPAEVLKPHLGHRVVCGGFWPGNREYEIYEKDDDNICTVFLVCFECGEMLYQLDKDDGAEREVDTQGSGPVPGSGPDKPEKSGEPEDMSDAFDDYPYENPSL